MDPWVGKIPQRRTWQPTAVFLPGEFHGQRSLSLPVCFFITSLPFFCSALHVKTAEDFLGSLAAGFGLGSSNGSRGDGEPRLLLSVPFSLRCYLVLISSHQPLMGKFSALPDSAQWLQSKEEVSLPLLPSMFPRRGPHYR